MINVKIKRLHPDAKVPTYATDGSACFDIYAIEDAYIDDIGHVCEIIPTGIAFEIPPGWQMLVFSRSGHAFKNNVRLGNCVAVIDSDYRGEVKLKLTADYDAYLNIYKGDRIAQAQLFPVYKASFIEVEDVSETERGAGGFGSTGA